MAAFQAPDAKIGFFDWITEFNLINGYFDAEHTLINDRQTSRILVAGCGTSKLSAQLADIGFDDIVSIDNDSGCISHMMNLHREDPRLKWYVHDLVEPQNTAMKTFHEVDGSFDLVVDKGTLDAILVEGSIHTMLHEVHRLLRLGGVYLLFSINSEQLLYPLLSMESLGFHVSCHELALPKPVAASSSAVSGSIVGLPSSDGEGLVISTVLVCKKVSDTASIDMQRLAAEERQVMDNYFQHEQPFLTAEEEDRIRNHFDCVGKPAAAWGIDESGAGMGMDTDVGMDVEDSVPCLDLAAAYGAMFDSAVGGIGGELEYTYELFLEDMARFPLRHPGRMTVDESIEFLRAMQ